MIIFLIIGIILGALSVVFALQNVEVVTVSFFNWSIQGSLSVIILVSLVLGMLIALLLTLPEMVGHGYRMRRLMRENEELESEMRHERHRIEDIATRSDVRSGGNERIVKEKRTETRTQTQY